MLDEPSNPYRAPQTAAHDRSQQPTYGWPAFPAFGMGVFGAVHLSFAAVAAVGLISKGGIVIGAVGTVCGLVGLVLSIQAGRAWLHRNWRDAILFSLLVMLGHVAELVLVV